jgi:hypothetical protein
MLSTLGAAPHLSENDYLILNMARAGHVGRFKQRAHTLPLASLRSIRIEWALPLNARSNHSLQPMCGLDWNDDGRTTVS